MAQGEKMWSSSGRTPKKFDNKPIPAGEYDLKVNADWKIKVAEGEGKVPYANGSFTALGSGVDGGKDRRVFHMFFLQVDPGKDGASMVERQNGLLGFARGLGTQFNLPAVSMEKQNLLSPKHAVHWLNSQDGAIVRATVKIQRGTNNYADSNRIDFFHEGEQQQEESDEAVAEFDGETEGEFDGGNADEGGADLTAGFPEPEESEEEAEFEAVPPKKAAKVAPAKMIAKPATKPVMNGKSAAPRVPARR